MHQLLKRQLKKYAPFTGEEPPAEWRAFLDAVNAAYDQADADRLMIERSLELSSFEIGAKARQVEEAKAALERSNEEFKKLAMTDELTGLYSRRFLFDALRHAVKATTRGAPRGVACLLADLDRFKSINDTKGHLVGDETLRTTAKALRGCTRETDAVGRFGGEEFVAVLSDVDAAGAKMVAEKMRAAVELTCPTTVSIGISHTEVLSLEVLRSAAGLEEVVRRLLSEADIAMYASKRAGRNRITAYTDALKSA